MSYNVENLGDQPPYSATYYISALKPFNGDAVHPSQTVIAKRRRGKPRRATTVNELEVGISDTTAMTTPPRHGPGYPRKKYYKYVIIKLLANVTRRQVQRGSL